MRRRTLAVVGSLAAGAVAAGSAVALTVADNPHVSAAQVTGATAHKPAKPGDFNGDGRRDLVLLDQMGLDPSGHHGRFVIVPGGPRGPVAAQRDVVTRGRAGLPVSRGGYFGSEAVSADFDGDGYADLATLDSGFGPTNVLVLYGGPKGLTSRHVVLPGSVNTGKLAVGDFDGNGKPDLIGVEDQMDGLKYRRFHYRTYANFGAHSVKPTVTMFATAPTKLSDEQIRVAAADFNGDGRTDLALNFISGDNENGPRRVAYVEVRYGGAKKLGAPKRYNVPADLPMAVGDINGDHRADLVVKRHLPKKPGQISVLYGGKAGLGKPVTFSKDSPGVPGTGSTSDGFGRSIAVGDLNGDGLADVAVGAPRTTLGKARRAGAVTVLYGTRKGLTGKGARSVNLSLLGSPNKPQHDELFGDPVAVQDLNGDGKGDLVVGAYNRDYGPDKPLGAVYYYPGGKGGPLLKGAFAITPPALNVKEFWRISQTFMP
ncbi:FG-GAP and VCBS repeat-containing protein [Spirillospora sp. NPDC052269]